LNGLIYNLDLQLKKMIHSDYEREDMLDIMYLVERQKQIEQEYWEWEHRKPAVIKVVIDKKEEEHENNPEQIRTTL
jgi:hypothetical protein